MTHEKRGVVEQGRTPPEDKEKAASSEQLEDHPTKRAADEAADSIRGNANSRADSSTQ